MAQWLVLSPHSKKILGASWGLHVVPVSAFFPATKNMYNRDLSGVRTPPNGISVISWVNKGFKNVSK